MGHEDQVPTPSKIKLDPTIAPPHRQQSSGIHIGVRAEKDARSLAKMCTPGSTQLRGESYEKTTEEREGGRRGQPESRIMLSS